MVVARPGDFLTAAMLNALAEDGVWTPVLSASVTPPTMGSGAVLVGSYHRSGREVTVDFDITFGSSGVVAGSGTYRLQGFPYPIGAIAAAQGGEGSIRIVDSSGAVAQMVLPRLENSTQVLLSNTAQPTALVTNAVPWTWAAGDSLRGQFTYLADI